ncbi:hypothetical protein OGM63_27685 [Plectonema radiosum NIES-515]|uniref:Uncharacterized protein n=1 Tax=Plectonema radiosum NIES-515 TaxID=2986073 RepID=A0ABT3B787_9CYAN|nr:hypothetical protein [Plectonema radiosum]MCV3217247.1 hypothetical protein [Plectonema radiosum NIES-515]
MAWKVDLTERKAAWSLYVELVTRIAVQLLEVDRGKGSRSDELSL